MIILLIAVILAAVALVVRFRTEERIAGDYLAVAKDVADSEALLASRLEDVLSGVTEMERPELLQRLEGLADESASLGEELATAEATASTSEANGFLTVAIDSWSIGLAGVNEAIIEILDGPELSRKGDEMLTLAFNDLQVGDTAYARFLGAVKEMDPDSVTLEYPDFGFISPPRDELYDALLLADEMRVLLRLEVNRDVAVNATTDPEPLGENNGFPVVPDSESFGVQVVVTNEGNLPEEQILVQLFLDPRDPAEEQVDIQTLVPFLEPGDAKTVPFLDLPVLPGALYELTVSATIADDEDARPGDNIWKLVFYRNQP